MTLRVTLDHYEDAGLLELLAGVAPRARAATVRRLMKLALQNGADVSNVQPLKKRKTKPAPASAAPSKRKEKKHGESD